MGCIYLATNRVNGKRYVGKTIFDLKKRKIGHKSCAEMGSETYFHRAIRKYGFGRFRWVVVADSIDEDCLDEAEQLSIDILSTRSPFGYNMTDGGDGGKGRKQPLAEKIRRAESNRGKKRRRKTKDKISLKLRGEGNGRCKLSKYIVLKMRQLRCRGWKVKDIAELFEIPCSTAGCVINGNAWSHLPGAFKTWKAKEKCKNL